MRLLEIVATVFISLFSLRALLLLIKPDLHTKVVSQFYTSKSRRAVYLILFLFGAGLIISDTDIVHFVIALITIGALYDYLFASFPEQAGPLIEEAEAHKGKVWIFALAVPFVSAAWLYIFLLLR